jgi:hypothetical protein
VDESECARTQPERAVRKMEDHPEWIDYGVDIDQVWE